MEIKVKTKVEMGIVHYELYIDGRFYCSEDTREEAERTKRRYLSGKETA